MGAEAGGGKSYIASTIHKADNRAYTRETLQPRACAALDRESAPSKCGRATGGQEKKKPPERTTTQTEKGEKAMYTEYGYIGKDGIEYATEQEAYEAQAENENE